jgi:hypothetical protein
MTREGVDIRFPRPGGIVEYNGDDENRAREDEPACIGNPTFGPSSATDTTTIAESDARRNDIYPEPLWGGCQAP